MLVIADPINDVYGGLPSRDLAALRGAGIDVVTPDLDALRDSNPIYSAFWRLTMKWWSGDGSGEARLPNPLDAGPDQVSFGAWARLLNFKADHRKVIIGDDGKGGITGIVTSANPHDASSLHSNVGLEAVGAGAGAAARERARAGARKPAGDATWRVPEMPAPARRAARKHGARAGAHRGRDPLRDRAQLRAARASATASTSRCSIYPSASVIQALLAAARRGVAVRVILDPNKDAFGRTKNGIPNRSVATELAAASDGAIKVRWFRTHGEQFHSKLVAMRTATEFWFTLGSANLTRRNLEDFNLEANIAASVPLNAEIADADQRLVRVVVDQPRPAGARIHRGVRRLRRSVAGQLLALPPHGSDRPIYLLTSAAADLRGRGCRRGARELAHRRRRWPLSNAADHRVERSSRGHGRSLRREAREQLAVAMPAERAVERDEYRRRPAAFRVVGFEAAQRAAQVVARRVRRRVVEHRGKRAAWRAARRPSRSRR